MRKIIPWSLCVAIGASACTDQNPAYNLDDGAVADITLRHDGERHDRGKQHDAAVDGQLAPDAFSCAPQQALRCSDDHTLEKCDAGGTLLIWLDCRPASCDPVALRCDECSPDSPPSCAGDVLVICNEDGLEERQACPQGCEAGKCVSCVEESWYRDADGDGYGDGAQQVMACTAPAGHVSNDQDCDDGDPLAHPGQASYFPTPSSGTSSFDYNCDGVEEQELLAKASQCAWTGSGCSGGGWKVIAPPCGQSGTYIDCVKKGGPGFPGCSAVESPKIQACR